MVAYQKNDHFQCESFRVEGASEKVPYVQQADGDIIYHVVINAGLKVAKMAPSLHICSSSFAYT
jgi:hypothetical protein